MTDFRLAAAFAETSAPLTLLGLSEARLQLDARWPWIVLIPRRSEACEIADLSAADRAALIEEVVAAGEAVRAVGAALGRPTQKLNVGALGNITPQLHVHIVGRRADDDAWPGPVWGFGEAAAYSREAMAIARSAALTALAMATLNTAT